MYIKYILNKILGINKITQKYFCVKNIEKLDYLLMFFLKKIIKNKKIILFKKNYKKFIKFIKKSIKIKILIIFL